MLFVLFLSLPSSTNLFGQIVIKERVQIEPKVKNDKNNQLQKNGDSHMLTLSFGWNTSTAKYASAIISYKNWPIEETSSVTGGSLTLSASITNQGRHEFGIGFRDENGLGVPMSTLVSFELDGEPYDEISASSGNYHTIFIRYPTCQDYVCETNSEYKAPEFIVVEIDVEDYPNYDFCSETTAGKFKALFGDPIHNVGNDELVQPFEIDVCFNNNSNAWQYRTASNNAIFLNSIVGVCDANISRFTVIYGFSDLDNLSDEAACIAYKDIENRKYFYGGGDGRDGMYILYDEIILHEKSHKKRFENLIKETLNSRNKDNSFGIEIPFYDLFTYPELDCPDNLNISDIKDFYKKHFNKILKQFLGKLKELYNKQKSNIYTNERDTHSDKELQNRMQEYLDYLKVRYPNSNCN